LSSHRSLPITALGGLLKVRDNYRVFLLDLQFVFLQAQMVDRGPLRLAVQAHPRRPPCVNWRTKDSLSRSDIFKVSAEKMNPTPNDANNGLAAFWTSLWHFNNALASLCWDLGQGWHSPPIKGLEKNILDFSSGILHAQAEVRQDCARNTPFLLQ